MVIKMFNIFLVKFLIGFVITLFIIWVVGLIYLVFFSGGVWGYPLFILCCVGGIVGSMIFYYEGDLKMKDNKFHVGDLIKAKSGDMVLYLI